MVVRFDSSVYNLIINMGHQSRHVVINVCLGLILMLLTGCYSIEPISLTSTPSPAETSTWQALVYEPTNPAGYAFPFNLNNITLSCPSPGNYLLEFGYLPTDITISSVGDPNDPLTDLSCSSRTAGHMVCTGNIDFGTLGVVSLQVCEGNNPITRMCISQVLLQAPCLPVQGSH